MSQTRDKRRRMDLDLFVLALIETGISTPYEFQRAASLSPGATIPALQRLLGSGLIRQGRPGPRGRTDHQITPAGKKLLKTGWRDLIEYGPSGDLDADLRVALLAWWVGRERRLAADFLKQSAAKKRTSIELLHQSYEPPSRSPLADWYVRLRSEAGKGTLRAESAAAFAMAKALPGKLSAGRRR